MYEQVYINIIYVCILYKYNICMYAYILYMYREEIEGGTHAAKEQV